MSNQQEIAIYRAENGTIEVKAKLQNDTLWLKQDEIASLFGVQRPTITKHIKKIFNTGELTENSVCSVWELTANDGKKYKTKLYNLDLIVSVGYRVNSKKATQFRIWAANVLKRYLTQGYSLNKQLLQEERTKIHSLQHAIGLLSHVFLENTGDITSAARLLQEFAQGLALLDDYDHNQLDE